MKFNTICGTPRSGSTLLQNILNQNPRFHASSTSCMAQTLRAISTLWSNSPEVKSDLIHDQKAAEERMRRSVRALMEAWYSDKEGAEVVFDKGRFWNHQAPALKHVFPEAHMFVCVRDPRDILASIEKQHGKNPLLDNAANPQQLTLGTRVESHCEPNGLVGQQIDGITDLAARKLPFVHVIEFKALVNNPQRIMEEIVYPAVEMEMFDHDFTNVENTATDADGLYNAKFPHKGSGPVVAPNDKWEDEIPPALAEEVMKRFSKFNSAFGYSNAG